MLDKQSREWSRPTISKVAQERDYYPADIERELNRQVEAPGHVALKLLRGAQPLQSSQWVDLLGYIAVMLMRVPRKRRKGWEAVPQVLESTMSRVRAEIADLRRPDNDDRVNATLVFLDRLEAKYAVTPPEEVQRQISSPWPSDRIARAVGTMAWRLVSIPLGHYLITSDNPAYFFESLGLGRDESELTFPISPSLALMGSRQGDPQTVVKVTAKPVLVKEINSRIASGAERFVFTHRRAEWIEKIALRKNPSLNRIQW
jgi:hypothetical protein